jgi:hypothetical protein
MELLLIFLAIVLLGTFAVTAIETGVDSREESDDPHRSSYPIGIG